LAQLPANQTSRDSHSTEQHSGPPFHTN